MNYLEGINYIEKKVWKSVDPNILRNKYHILGQEFSRRCMFWEIIRIPVPITLPPIILEILVKPGIYLAGGAIPSLFRRQYVADWDIFYTDVSSFNSIISRYNEYYETENAITVYTEGLTLQFIKRQYQEPEHIIGGFDLDICRFIVIDGAVWGALTAIRAIVHNQIFLNLYCKSKTFGYRVRKYQLRGYKTFSIEPHNTKHIRVSSYAFDKMRHQKEALDPLLCNLEFLLRKQYGRLFIHISTNKFAEKQNGGLFSTWDFERKILERPPIVVISKNIRIITVYDDEVYIYTRNKKILIMNHCNYRTFTINILRARYHRYAALKNLRITGSSSQFTGSYDPIPHQYTVKICPLQIKACIWVFKLCGFPRYIINRIMVFYVNKMIFAHSLTMANYFEMIRDNIYIR